MKYGNYLKERKQQLPEDWQKVFIQYEELKQFIKHHIAPACLKPNLANQQTWPTQPPQPAGSVNNTPLVPAPLLDYHPSPALGGSLLPAAHEDLNAFSSMIATRLTILQTRVPEFLAMLDEQVGQVSTFTSQQTRKIYEAYGTFQGGQIGLGLVHGDSKLAQATGTSPGPESTPKTTEPEDSLETLLQSVIKLEKYIFLNYTGIVKITKKMDRHAGLGISEAYLGHVWKLPFARAEQLSSLKKELMEKLSGVLTKINVNVQQEVTSTGRSGMDHVFTQKQSDSEHTQNADLSHFPCDCPFEKQEGDPWVVLLRPLTVPSICWKQDRELSSIWALLFHPSLS